MITESFLNSCYSVVINKTIKIKKNKALYRDILSVMGFHESKEQLEIPMGVKSKFDCLKKLCEMKLDDKICAVFGLGDHISYAHHFVGYLLILYRKHHNYHLS